MRDRVQIVITICTMFVALMILALVGRDCQQRNDGRSDCIKAGHQPSECDHAWKIGNG